MVFPVLPASHKKIATLQQGCCNLATTTFYNLAARLSQPCYKVAQTMELKLWRDGNNLAALLQGCGKVATLYQASAAISLHEGAVI